MAQISRKVLAEAIITTMPGMSTRALAQTVAAYLVSEQRTRDLEPLMRDISQLREMREGILEVTATSAFVLSEEIKKELQKIFSAPTVRINEVIDPSVIGGVRVESSDRILDLTVRNRLNQLKSGLRS